MSVEKIDVVAYRVTANGEGGTFVLREWKSGEYHAGELLIRSTFGSYGHYWGNMGSPLRKLLRQINRGYLSDKLFGLKAEVLDFDKSIIKAHDISNDAHAAGTLSAEQHEELGEWIDSLEHTTSEDGLWGQMRDMPDFVDHELLGTGAFIVKRENPQFTGLYEQLWPLLLAEFQREATPA